ncbi:MAG: hypothetical protein RL653_1279 [Pseudomonadota bacterium]|jgi:opacity protein-like surface antigen
MKRTLVAATLAAVTWGGAALAQGAVESEEAWQEQQQEIQCEGGACPPPTGNAPGIEPGIEPGTGGTGEAGVLPPPQTNVNVNIEQPPAPAPAVAPVAAEPKKKDGANMRGLTLTLGGGVEGYTGGLSDQIRPGPAWAVSANIRPTRVLGLELGYNGAANNVRGTDLVDGADIVRNGGQAVATVGLTAAAIQPYLLGGVGLSRYNVRGGDNTRFKDDTTGHIPVGAGLRTHVGPFTADARFNYDVLFDTEFATNVEARDIAGVNTVNGGRYLGTLNLGGTF